MPCSETNLQMRIFTNVSTQKFADNMSNVAWKGVGKKQKIAPKAFNRFFFHFFFFNIKADKETMPVRCLYGINNLRLIISMYSNLIFLFFILKSQMSSRNNQCFEKKLREFGFHFLACCYQVSSNSIKSKNQYKWGVKNTYFYWNIKKIHKHFSTFN